MSDEYIRAASTTQNSVLLVTSRRAHESSTSYFFTDPEYIVSLFSLDSLPQLFDQLELAQRRGLFAAGYLSYECGYGIESSVSLSAPQSDIPLAWFGFYRSRKSFDYIQPPSGAVTLSEPALDICKEEYVRKIEEIKKEIKAGNTYQVNFTTRLRWQNEIDSASLFTHLMAVQPVEFGAFINLGDIQILSASPELFCRRSGKQIIARPMKGTAARGFTIEEQKLNAAWLANDEKNRAENVMIVDLLRHDLRRVCEVHSVKVKDLCVVETFPTVLQMVSTIVGQLRNDIGYGDIFRALFPCGSITGAPKVRTMQIIRRLEDTARGVYTGSIGFTAPDDEAVFNVAIRTLVLKDGRVSMGVGGGIVWDSDPLEEYEECRIKAAFLTRSAAPFQLVETMKWDGEYVLLHEHLARLASSAEYFSFPFSVQEITSRLPESFTSPYRVRLTLSCNGKINVTSMPLEGNWSGKIVLSDRRTNASDLFLRHKTTRRQLYDSEFKRAVANGYDDVLFLNAEGYVTESAIHNIFMRKDGRLFTPPISDGALPGVLRASMDVTEWRFTVEDLSSFDEIYLGNSVRGLRKLHRIDRSDSSLIWIDTRNCDK